MCLSRLAGFCLCTGCRSLWSGRQRKTFSPISSAAVAGSLMRTQPKKPTLSPLSSQPRTTLSLFILFWRELQILPRRITGLSKRLQRHLKATSSATSQTAKSILTKLRSRTQKSGTWWLPKTWRQTSSKTAHGPKSLRIGLASMLCRASGCSLTSTAKM